MLLTSFYEYSIFQYKPRKNETVATGGAGFIGANLLILFKNRDYEIVVFNKLTYAVIWSDYGLGLRSSTWPL